MNYSGHRFGRYQLIKRIGRGGFADVYEAWDPLLRRQVAIKVLRGDLAQRDRASLLKEARTLAHLDHPHIIKVIELDIHRNIPYLVITYAPNGSLRRLHPYGTTLSLDTIIDYVQQIADALSYIHRLGIVHRDIKPENLLLGWRNEILLADFGIAELIRNTMPHQMRSIIGTAAYLAPERFHGKCYPASDQYSLAVIILEWLTGEALFYGSTEQIKKQHFDMSALNRRMDELSVPRIIKQVLLKALSLKPENRYENVQAFALALNQAKTAIQGQANLDERENTWYEAVCIFTVAPFPSVFAGFITSIAGFGFNAALLVTTGVLLFVSVLGCLFRSNLVAKRLIMGSSAIAGLIALVFGSYGIFCLILLISFFLCLVIGLVVVCILSWDRR